MRLNISLEYIKHHRIVLPDLITFNVINVIEEYYNE